MDDCPLCEGVGEVTTLEGKTIGCPQCVLSDLSDRCKRCVEFLDAARRESGLGGSLKDAHDWLESIVRSLA